jgi:hypothetical protein
MTKAYILNMANHELMRKIEVEENHLKARPEDTIAPARLERFWAEEKELHAMILEAERTEEKA